MKIWEILLLNLGLTFWNLTVFPGLLPGKKNFQHPEITIVNSLVFILPDLVGFLFVFLYFFFFFA